MYRFTKFARWSQLKLTVTNVIMSVLLLPGMLHTAFKKRKKERKKSIFHYFQMLTSQITLIIITWFWHVLLMLPANTQRLLLAVILSIFYGCRVEAAPDTWSSKHAQVSRSLEPVLYCKFMLFLGDNTLTNTRGQVHVLWYFPIMQLSSSNVVLL